MKRYAKLCAIVINCGMIVILLSSCAKDLHGSNFCALYQPVYVHRQDTEETKYQVDQNNVLWAEFCQ